MLCHDGNPGTLVYPDSNAGELHADGPLQSSGTAWETAWRNAGLVGRIPHDFRRTAGRNLERAGVPRSTAMKMVGHKTESIYRRYAIVDEAMLRGAGGEARAGRSGEHLGGDGPWHYCYPEKYLEARLPEWAPRERVRVGARARQVPSRDRAHGSVGFPDAAVGDQFGEAKPEDKSKNSDRSCEFAPRIGRIRIINSFLSPLEPLTEQVGLSKGSCRHRVEHKSEGHLKAAKKASAAAHFAVNQVATDAHDDGFSTRVNVYTTFVAGGPQRLQQRLKNR